MISTLRSAAVEAARKCTGSFVFRKCLPSRFGGARMLVTSRADIRILKPGWEGPAGDLMVVTDKYVSEGMTVWDIGANLGILSFCAAFKAGTTGAVFSVEADPKYAEIQNRTARTLPGGYAPVTPLCAAVSDDFGLLSLVIPRNGHARNHLSVVSGNSAKSAESSKAVVTITLDFLLKFWPAPNFLKIDVEGAEIMALRGADELLRKARPIIYIEVSEENSREATRILSGYGYDLYSLSANGEESPISECSFNTLAKPRQE